MWLTSGRITNPAINQVLVDTGPLVAGPRMWQVFASATVNCPLELQYVASDGTTVLKSQVVAIPTMGTTWLSWMLAEVVMAANERLRIIAVTAITGTISCSLDISV